ncbi:MAG: substrate-binding domain-containing protein [Dehalococcoidia bacterium]|jgi:tungstate transport system substrate-binding protein|nr:substrate-binding domain-containing protein [Dehalococcoidia bacterium]
MLRGVTIRRWLAFIALVALAGGVVGCGNTRDTNVILATTTSTFDTGLLDVLIPEFEKESGYNVKPIAVGTGKALAMGERGEADVLLVHAPAAEAELLASGAALDRKPVMHNFFVLVGPQADPARVMATSSVGNAMASIERAGSDFMSRGDDSGTHKMEMSLWDLAGVAPGGHWYQETGQGMGATLQIASQKSAYTLSDRATYIALSNVLDLGIVSGSDGDLLNTYSVLQLNGDRFSGLNVDGGRAFAEFLLSMETQATIRDFGIDSYGEPLFIPGPASGPGEPAS